MEPYVLLPVATRNGAVEGLSFHTFRRTRWKFTLRVSSLESGGSVDVILEGAPQVSDDDDYETLHDFGTVSATGTTTIYSYDPPGSGTADFSLTEEHLWIRTQVESAVGDYTLEVLAEARFLDLLEESHVALLPSSIRDSIESRDRIVDRAERDLLQWLQRGIPTKWGVLAVRSDAVEADDLIREAIVQQAIWQARKDSLRESGDVDDRADGFRMAHLSPDAKSILSPILRHDLRVWRGR